MSKNSVDSQQLITIECLRLSSDGSGVGYHEGKATFVPGLLPGETGEIRITTEKKNWQRGRLLTLGKRSAERMEPPCPIFGLCGGCQLQHLSYPQTLLWKKCWVEDALTRIGKISPEKVAVRPTLGMDKPWRYRNKARLHRGEGNSLGYYQGKSQAAVPFADCLLLSEEMNRWIREAGEILDKQDKNFFPDLSSLIFRENSQGEGLLILDSLKDAAEAEPWAELVKKAGRTIRSVWGINSPGEPEQITGRGEFTEDVLGLEFKLSPLAFLQVNPLQTRKLYNQVLDWADLSAEQVVWDLYCGIGTITLALAAKAKKVWGVEENPYAVEDARGNARRNRVGNVEFIAGKVEDTFQQIGDSPHIVVLDPPRAGAHRSVLERLLELKPGRIIYVSCDPGTLARDLGILQSGGYKVDGVQPVDMFPWTVHVECVIMMTYCGFEDK